MAYHSSCVPEVHNHHQRLLPCESGESEAEYLPFVAAPDQPPINPNTPRTGMLRDHSAVHLVTALYLYNFHGEPGNIDAALLGPRRGRSSLVWQ